MELWFHVAIICNSTVIEIYCDKIQVSQRFRGCQMLEYIAAPDTKETGMIISQVFF
jgi:hypothetical protein